MTTGDICQQATLTKYYKASELASDTGPTMSKSRSGLHQLQDIDQQSKARQQMAGSSGSEHNRFIPVQYTVYNVPKSYSRASLKTEVSCMLAHEEWVGPAHAQFYISTIQQRKEK